MIGCDDQLRPLNAQRAGFKPNRIVPLCFLSGGRDGIAADIFTRIAGDRKGKQFDCFVPFAKRIGIGPYAGRFIQHRSKRPAFFVPVQAVDFHFPFGVFISVGLLRVHSLNGQGSGSDGELCGRIGHGIIALLRFTRERYAVCTNILARLTGQLIGQHGCFVATPKPVNRSRQLRIVLAILF